ncbi:hypothetical protein GCWU000325_01908 [Alloprevotella tannerae ATCC 51259]|uniref:Uncharacterized protein n=1 Tax=Alloprevotella tannerae ATCC 51259 TaxID=626522 RepID=C9LI50_9BACT|nr:hypothetical protein GCWU000325_01908 [Alloprevotella tannerae ATCC 51259]
MAKIRYSPQNDQLSAMILCGRAVCRTLTPPLVSSSSKILYYGLIFN